MLGDNIQDVILITTGGTIDKSYNEMDGSLSNRDSLLKNQILDMLRLPYTNIHLFNIINKDSLHFTDYDRSLLAKTLSVQIQRGHPIIVLHGTDTMAKSAEFCLKTLSSVSVPIIFTGAMTPMGFTNSDARQNVTEALVASKLLPSGIYISFHNKIFTVPNVRKNIEKRTFEEI